MTGCGPTYELRVEGHLDDHWAVWLGDLTLVRHDDGTSTLSGAVSDQAQLYGVIMALRDLGATLVSITSAPALSPEE